MDSDDIFQRPPSLVHRKSRNASAPDAADIKIVMKESLNPPDVPKSSFLVLGRQSLDLETPEGSSSWITGMKQQN